MISMKVESIGIVLTFAVAVNVGNAGEVIIVAKTIKEIMNMIIPVLQWKKRVMDGGDIL